MNLSPLPSSIARPSILPTPAHAAGQQHTQGIIGGLIGAAVGTIAGGALGALIGARGATPGDDLAILDPIVVGAEVAAPGAVIGGILGATIIPI